MAYGSITQRGDKYRVCFDYGVDREGKRVRKYRTFDTKRDAIRAFNEVLRPRGITKCGIRLDSGDMAYLTREARQMLDEAGWSGCQISASNSLDEYIIQDLLRQGACIDLFGVGERMITARSEPVCGGVYKLAAVEDDH